MTVVVHDALISGRIHPYVTSLTPGTARTRSRAARKNGSVLSGVAPAFWGLIASTSRRSASNPSRVARSARSVLTNSAAPTSTTTAIATCATRNTRRAAADDREEVSRSRTNVASNRRSVSAGSDPKRIAQTNAVPAWNSNTAPVGFGMAIDDADVDAVDACGPSGDASWINNSANGYASAAPSAAPASDSIRLSTNN